MALISYIGTPTAPGVYTESALLHDLANAPIYRRSYSGAWHIGVKRVPESALPAGLVRLVPERN